MFWFSAERDNCGPLIEDTLGYGYPRDAKESRSLRDLILSLLMWSSLTLPTLLHRSAFKPVIAPLRHLTLLLRLVSLVLVMADSKDPSAQSRIISHMNADHQDSLIRYLRYYHRQSSFSARNAKLVTIDFSALTIIAPADPFSAKHYRIPIDPPLASWADARPRLVAMDKEACSTLQCSPVTVKRWVRPDGVSAAVSSFILWVCVTFSRRANFLPGSFYYQYFFGFVPSFAAFCHLIQPFLFYGVLAIHVMELFILMGPRLRKHTVRMFSGVWWLWILSNYIEGGGAVIRFDRLVKEEEDKRAKQKH